MADGPTLEPVETWNLHRLSDRSNQRCSTEDLMNFQQAVSAYYNDYAEFSGRTSRSGYWWVALWSVIIGAVIVVIGAIAPPLGTVLYYGYLITHLIPGLAIAVR